MEIHDVQCIRAECYSQIGLGKGASRRLRRLAEMVPAIIYGEGKAPVNISIPHKDIQKALSNEAFYSHIITLNRWMASRSRP
jgi:ribosomal protein L25 (general stress protein Ctc)